MNVRRSPFQSCLSVLSQGLEKEELRVVMRIIAGGEFMDLEEKKAAVCAIREIEGRYNDPKNGRIDMTKALCSFRREFIVRHLCLS